MATDNLQPAPGPVTEPDEETPRGWVVYQYELAARVHYHAASAAEGVQNARLAVRHHNALQLLARALDGEEADPTPRGLYHR